MSVDIATPQPCAPGPPWLTARKISTGTTMPDDAGHERQHEPAPVAQVAEVELAPRLQPDDEEEQRHQAAVDPRPQVAG